MTDAPAMTRRAFLVRGSLAVAGVAVGAGAIAAAITASREELLTASMLSPLVGTAVRVAHGGVVGWATVRPLEGLGATVAERSFELTLMSDADLPPVGGMVTVQHRDLGEHRLFMSPTRNPREWVAVVNELKA